MHSRYNYYFCTVCSVFSLSWLILAFIILFLCVNCIYFEMRVTVFHLVYVHTTCYTMPRDNPLLTLCELTGVFILYMFHVNLEPCHHGMGRPQIEGG
jgi:hypothetical protein